MIVNKNTKYLSLGGKIADLQSGLIMGVINVTPDSFYKNSRVDNIHDIVEKIAQMLEEGMDILDIGGFSSRPGASLPGEREEWDRLLPVLKRISIEFPDLALSIDTFRSEIARRSVSEYGVSMINDISGGGMDEKMPSVIAELQVPVVLMHMQGNPETMQKEPVYSDVVLEIIHYFTRQTKLFQDKGVNDIIIDPGFGFGKTAVHNYTILNKLDMFSILNRPILVGISRKSMIYESLNCTPEEAMNGTTVLNSIARYNGADILRVHDVREASECLKLVNRLKTI